MLLLSAIDVPAQDEKSTVREVVDHVASRLSLNDKTRVLGAQIEDSLDTLAWKIQLRDPNYKSSRRLLELMQGKIVSDEAGTLEALRNTSLVELEAQELRESAGSLRKRAHAMAQAAGIEPKTYRFVLFHPEEKKAARWYLYAFDGQGKTLGRAALNARTGEVLASTWGIEAVRTAEGGDDNSRSNSDTGAEFVKFGRDVERTFKGIGADLEKFFTGKRTIDK